MCVIQQGSGLGISVRISLPLPCLALLWLEIRCTFLGVARRRIFRQKSVKLAKEASKKKKRTKQIIR